MSTLDNLIANYSKVAYTSYFDSDKIIGVLSGTFTVSAPSASPGYTTNNVTQDTGFGDSCYFQGIFSTDSGSSWNDFGTSVPNTSSATPVLDTVTCQGFVTTAGIFTAVGKNWYDYLHSSGTAKTILYKVALFSKINQGSIQPLPTNEENYFDSLYNYHKIYLQDFFAVSTSANTSIQHNLGYIPKVRSFFQPTSSSIGIDGIYTVPAGAMATLDWWTGAGSGASADIQIDTSNAVFTPIQDSSSTPNGINGTQHYLIYLDAQ